MGPTVHPEVLEQFKAYLYAAVKLDQDESLGCEMQEGASLERLAQIQEANQAYLLRITNIKDLEEFEALLSEYSDDVPQDHVGILMLGASFIREQETR